jgi:dimethylglycine dehydrogenase
VRSEFTILPTGAAELLLVSPALGAARYDYLPRPPATAGRCADHHTHWGVLVIAGPRSREVLQKLTTRICPTRAFPWLTGKPISVGHAHAHALRVNFVGELGWELHHPIEMQNTIFDLVMDAGREFGIRPFGIRAMMSMAVEKSYRLIGRELSIEYAALESGLDRFVHLNKGQFIGRDALVSWQQRGFNWRFVTMAVDGVTDADARGSEPILIGDKLVGRATNGGFGWRYGKSWRSAWSGRSTASLAPNWTSRSSASAAGPPSSRRAPTTRRTSGSEHNSARPLPLPSGAEAVLDLLDNVLIVGFSDLGNSMPKPCTVLSRKKYFS